MSEPAVSILIPCRNEADTIEECLRSALAQEAPPGGFELLVADGMSDDGTREKILAFMRADPRLRLIDNPRRIVSTGLNAAIRAARGAIIVRMDAHSRYAPDYVRQCVAVLVETGADNVGGPHRTEGRTYLERAICAAFHSSFVVGGAKSHNVGYEGPLDTVIYGCWKRETFERIGFFDEQLVRNQDDELNLRITRAGGKVWQSPRIRSWHHPRGTLGALFGQYMQYGYWKVRVIQKHKAPASWRHLVPGTFLLLLIVLAFGAPFWGPLLWAWLGVVGLYTACTLVAAAVAAVQHGVLYFPVLPPVIACYHFGYAYGFLRGVLDQGIWRRSGAPESFTMLTRGGARPRGAEAPSAAPPAVGEAAALAVSVLVPCRNEAAGIREVLRSILDQQEPPGSFEVLVADGMSTDDTREIVQEFARQDPRVRLFENSGIIVSTALNKALELARGEVVIRMDAHTQYPPDYVCQCLAVLADSGAEIVGGVLETVPRVDTPMAWSIAHIQGHWFGVGNARYRTGAEVAGPADTVPFPCYRREVFARVGVFNERLVRGQDLELNARLRRAGGMIWLDPRIHSRYHPPDTLWAFLKKQFRNGQWVVYQAVLASVLTLRLRHFIPLGFIVWVLGWGLATVGHPVEGLSVLAATAGVYGAIALLVTLRLSRLGPKGWWGFYPLLFLANHFSYGLGSFWGLLSVPCLWFQAAVQPAVRRASGQEVLPPLAKGVQAGHKGP